MGVQRGVVGVGFLVGVWADIVAVWALYLAVWVSMSDVMGGADGFCALLLWIWMSDVMEGAVDAWYYGRCSGCLM